MLVGFLPHLNRVYNYWLTTKQNEGKKNNKVKRSNINTAIIISLLERERERATKTMEIKWIENDSDLKNVLFSLRCSS